MPITITNESTFAAMIAAFEEQVDAPLVAEWQQFERDELAPAIAEIRAIRSSPDYTPQGRARKSTELRAARLKSPGFTQLRERASRATNRRAELRAQRLTPPTAPRIGDLQGLYDALAARDEAKDAAARLGRDEVRIVEAFADAIARQDTIELRALHPLRRHLRGENAKAVERLLIEAAPGAEEYRQVEAEVTMWTALLQAAEADLQRAVESIA